MKRAYIFSTWIQTTFTEGGRELYLEKRDGLVKKEKRGYLLEVDVEYPKELHKNHNELPFLAERMKIAGLLSFNTVIG